MVKAYETEIESINNSSSEFSNIVSLGKDEKKRIYWMNVESRDRIYVSEGDQWAYYPS